MANTLTLKDVVGCRVRWNYGDAYGMARLVGSNHEDFAVIDKDTGFYLPFKAAHVKINLEPVFEVDGLFRIELYIEV